MHARIAGFLYRVATLRPFLRELALHTKQSFTFLFDKIFAIHCIPFCVVWIKTFTQNASISEKLNIIMHFERFL